MISKKEFNDRIQKLPKSISSKTGAARYSSFKLREGSLEFVRANTRKLWTLDVDVLYNIYKANRFIDTTVVKKATGGRTNSPAVAVLMAIGCFDPSGNRIG